MKKMWVKKENLYHKPFYKQKFKMTCLAVILMAIIFYIYQIFYMNQLQLSITSPSIVQAHRDTNNNNNNNNNKNMVKKTTKSNVNTIGKKQQRQEQIRGIHLKDISLYVPNVDGKFKCFKSGRKILFDRINDNYCDCPEDGSDEPGTNACPVGVFYCKTKTRRGRFSKEQPFVINSRVNDGICDCCDGSDEWQVNNSNDLITECFNTCV